MAIVSSRQPPYLTWLTPWRELRCVKFRVRSRRNHLRSNQIKSGADLEGVTRVGWLVTPLARQPISYYYDACDISYFNVVLCPSSSQILGAVKFLIAEHSEVSKTRHLTVKFLSADFAAARKNSGKNLCCVLKIDGLLTYVSKMASHILIVDGEKNKKILHFNVIIWHSLATVCKKYWLVNLVIQKNATTAKPPLRITSKYDFTADLTGTGNRSEEVTKW